MDLAIKTVIGDGIKPFLSDIARLRIDIFREFPYLYVKWLNKTSLLSLRCKYIVIILGYPFTQP